jgi:predicted AAA+ superfamily ATPase
MQGMHNRAAIARLHQLARQFPAVLILGARQVGKTTLARAAFHDLPYCDLEDPATRALFAEDARFQLDARARPGVVLDEAQSVPAVFAALRGAIDADRAPGRFVLLGSAQPALVRQVAETLTGRVRVLELDPLTAAEAATGEAPQDWRNLWLAGGFPDALHAHERGGSFRDWWESYLRTFIERDLPALGLTVDPLLMRRLLTMLAHAQGGLANLSQLGAALGVSHTTVTRYVGILEQSFLLRRLPPYFRNVGKRLVKSPKLYLRDTGLLHHLLNIESLAALDSHPARGASWETFVLEDLARREAVRYPHSRLFFWRTAAGAEVDLVIERGATRHLVEIKTARGTSPHLARSLRAALPEVDAIDACVLDQAEGVEPLAAGIHRRGYPTALDWLPGEASA